MSDQESKSALPAWQQAVKLQDQAATTAAAKTNEQSDSTTSDTSSKQDAAPTTVAPSSASPAKSSNEADQRDQIRAFLEDPAVVNQNEAKKRAFLQSKEMPADLVNEELARTAASKMTSSDFDSFKSQGAVRESQPEEIVQPPPPIITYPEFLADAHRSPPLITPTRVLATTYVASAAAALTYAASTFLVKPMIAQLTDARHEFAEHNSNKVAELNSRLEKLVGQLPGTKQLKDDDASSVSSDATDLLSKDTGTQTDTAAQTEPLVNKVTILEPTAIVKQVEKLNTLEKQLSEVLASTQKEGAATEERESNVKKLRHYLDGLTYGGSGLNVWSNTSGQYVREPYAREQSTEQQKDKKGDAIEELKKEIRGVKGVLLSAKRFPSAARTPYQARPSSAVPT